MNTKKENKNKNKQKSKKQKKTKKQKKRKQKIHVLIRCVGRDNNNYKWVKLVKKYMIFYLVELK